jgi:L-cysteine desulfidase
MEKEIFIFRRLEKWVFMANLVETVKNEIIEVVGCTEPSAIAYAFAKLSEFYKTTIVPEMVKADLYLSHDGYRTASTPGIPYIA